MPRPFSAIKINVTLRYIRRIVNCLIALPRNILTYLLTYLLTCYLLLFKGYAAGPLYDKGGVGSNFLCLPEDSQWKTYRGGDQLNRLIAGVEYELSNSINDVFSEVNNGGDPLFNNPAPCVFCYAQGRSTVAMIPARTQCPDGWIMEYAGYLVSE